MTRHERNALLIYCLIGIVSAGVFGLTGNPVAYVGAGMGAFMAVTRLNVIAIDEHRKRNER